MAEICILTDDERLYRLLSLLVAECGHTVGDSSPALLITDQKSLPSRHTRVARIEIGDAGIPRPFSHASMKAAILERLSDAPLPSLTPTEEKLYRALVAASPHPVGREMLSRLVFGTEEDGGRLNLYIHYLRKKIEADGQKRIFSAHGKGYYYDASHTCR